MNLYAFGDSFTNYAWPMWPEILAQNFDKTENHGFAGSGNFQIFFSCMFLLQSGRIKENDTVIIQWSEPLRHDFLDDGFWANMGISSAEKFILAGLDDFNNIETVELKQLFYMYSIAKMLNEKKCNWLYMFLNTDSMVHKFVEKYDDSYLLINKARKEMANYLSFYKDNIIDEISMTDFFSNEKMKINKVLVQVDNKKLEMIHDSHPLPRYSLRFIEKEISKRITNLNFDSMQQYVNKVEEFALSAKIKNIVEVQRLIKKFNKTTDFKKTDIND